MTTLTKVFTVVLAFFAVVISMLVVQNAVHSTNYRELAQVWKSKADEYQALQVAEANASKIKIEFLNKELAIREEQLSKQRGEMQRLSSETSTTKNELLAEKQKTASLTGQVTQLTNMTKAGDDERKQLQDQFDQTRKDNAGLRADNFKLSESNQKLELQRQLYEQEIRLLKEQNFSLNERLEKVRVRVASGSGDGAPAAAGKVQAASESESSPIMGQVTEVHDTLASISVGAAQGVKEGMEFIVYRNGQYLGKLRVSKVLPDQSAGELLASQGSIRSGDKVTDKFQF